MEWAHSFRDYAGGRRASVGGLTDEALGKRLRTYKRQVAKRYRVLAPDQISRALQQGPYWISAKADGELWFLVKKAGEVALCSFNGRVHLGTPLVQEAERLLADAPDLVIAGELTATPKADDRSRVYHVASALGDESLEPSLAFLAFDLVEEGGEDRLLTDYAVRYNRLRALFGEGERVRVVPTVEGDAGEVSKRFQEWVASEQYEGIVVRSERGLTYKIKSTLTLDAVVIAYGERITGDVRQMREMSLALLREDGRWQLVGPVGGGFSEEDRAAWHARLSALEVPSSFRLANREGTLSRFVKPEIVLEIRCSDLLASDSWDAPIKRMSLAFDAEAGWSPVAEQPTAVMIHPVFLRERTDKTIDVGTVGVTQLTSRVPIQAPAETEAPAPTRDAEVLRRQVFVKETKGKVAVRKYVILATHRTDPDWAPYLAFFTDYSAGRREPLQTALRSASSEERASDHATAWLAANVKRGWREVEEQRRGTPVEAPPEVSALLAAAKEKATAAAKKAAKKKASKKKASE